MSNLKTEEKALIKAHAFAQILSPQANDSGYSELVYCPLQLIDNNLLLGHLAKNNPLVKTVKNKSEVKVIFTGPHGYISPRWHSEQAVPTWNYATVSLRCNVSFINNSSEKLKAMEKISQYFDPQWSFAEFNHAENAKKVQQMLTAIVVFNLTITHVKSKFKLSQNRSIECRTAFQEKLNLTGYKDLAKIQLL